MTTVASLLAGSWCVVPDLSTPYIQQSAVRNGFPARLSTPHWPTLGQADYTVFFNSMFARNWQGGMTFVKPSGAILLVGEADLLYGIDTTAGALTPSNEFVAYTFASGALDETGWWSVYLTSPTAAYGTGQGVMNAGSGPGRFLVTRS